MGKDFERELRNLNLIYQGALAGDIRVLTGFLQKYIHLPFLSVGSGGSLSVAHIFEYLCAKSGGIAKSLTPMELTLFSKQMRETAVLLFTAGGRNKDSIHAYQYLSESEPEGLLTCCMCASAPIKELQRNNLHNDYFEYQMPGPKDGYLAVESLVSSMALLCRAFQALTGSSFFRLPDTVSWGTHGPGPEQVESILAKETLIVLHGGITTPVAVDLESKFSEVSLGNIQLVDFRNFAHGRHYWLSNRRDRTAVVSMTGTSMGKIADKTLGLLPQDIPVIRFDIGDQRVFEQYSRLVHTVPGRGAGRIRRRLVYGNRCGEERMRENTTYVRNIKKYLLAALYNAPGTISNYYSSLVQHDMYGNPGPPQSRQTLWGEEEQGSGRSFRLQAETEYSGLCDDEKRGRG